MKSITRAEVFQHYPQIQSFVSGFQTTFFDEKCDSPEDEPFDALTPLTEVHTKNLFLRVPGEIVEEHPQKLTKKIKALADHLKTEKFLVLSHLKLDFFGNLQHDFPPVQKVYQHLSSVFPHQTYKEALELKRADWSQWITILFWLERCDPEVSEYIFWCCESQQYAFFICRYGNLHFFDLTNGQLIDETQLQELGFLLDDENQFDNDATEGRQINL